jgi:hypothetical protein
MNAKLVVLLIATACIVGSAIGTKVLGQPTQPIGRWQMVAGSGGDGGNAWKFNVDTGQSYFCYRQNCFPSGTGKQ